MTTSGRSDAGSVSSPKTARSDEIGGGNGDEHPSLQVPDALAVSFTPEEIEQAKDLFTEIDADESMAIDIEELRSVFDKLEEDISEKELQGLIDQVDEDGSGEIDFGEFLHLLNSFKNGNSKFSKAAALAERLHATPTAILEKECTRRHLELKYRVRGVREADASNAKHIIMEVAIFGEWREVYNGEVRRVTETRTFQGIGRSTRAAKFKAATSASSKMREYIPGMDYEPGVIPPKWMNWFEENTERGVDDKVLLRILTAKGFYPCKNILLMQKLSLRVSMLRLMQAEPGLWPTRKGRQVPVEWLRWAEENMQRGVHGSVVLGILVENGFVPERNPLLMQVLKKDRGGRMMDKVKPRVSDFWQAAASGEVDEVERYLAGGQEPNERKAIAGLPTSALSLAARASHLRTVKMLVENGADCNDPDKYGRTAMHMTALGGSRIIIEYLVSKGGNVQRRDRYGDTPLHVACLHGHNSVVSFLLEWQDERNRRFLSGKDIVAHHGLAFCDAVKRTFEAVMNEKLTKYDSQLYRKSWIQYGVKKFVEENDRKKYAVQVATDFVDAHSIAAAKESPVRFITDYVQHVDPKIECMLAPPSRAVVEFVTQRRNLDPEDENIEFEDFLWIVEAVISDAYVNSQNDIGRSPLMLAADPPYDELTQGHQGVLLCLLDEHSSNPRIKNLAGQTAEDLLRKRVGELQDPAEATMLLRSFDAALAQEEKDMNTVTEPVQTGWLEEHLDTSGEVEMQWRNLTASSVIRRSFHSFDELRDEHTKQIFYRSRGPDVVDKLGAISVSGMSQWMKPDEVIEHEKLIRGWDIIKIRSTVVRASGLWQRYWDEAVTGGTFYFHIQNKTLQFEKPDDWRGGDKIRPASLDGREYGWKRLARRSTKQSAGETWIEWKDPQSGARFWKNKITEEFTAAPPNASDAAVSDALVDFQVRLTSDVEFQSWVKLCDYTDGDRGSWSLALHKVLNESRREMKKLYAVGDASEMLNEKRAMVVYMHEKPGAEFSFHTPQSFTKKRKELWRWRRMKHVAEKIEESESWTLYNLPEGDFYYNEAAQEGAWDRPDEMPLSPDDDREPKFMSSKSAKVLLEMQDDDWNALWKQGKLVKLVETWSEYVFAPSAKEVYVFYRCSLSEKVQWEKPSAVVLFDGNIVGWEAMHLASAPICSLRDQWEKRRLTFSNQVYFRNLNDDSCQWERPTSWSSLADKNDLNPAATDINLEALAVRAVISRRVEDWVEYLDPATSIVSYCQKSCGVHQLEKPMCVALLDLNILLWTALRGREAGRKRANLKVLKTSVEANGGVWKEECDYFACYPGLPRTYYVFESPEETAWRVSSDAPAYFLQDVPVADSLEPENGKSNHLEADENENLHSRPKEAEDTATLVSNMSLDSSTITKKARTLRNAVYCVRAAAERLEQGYVLCFWGCMEWVDPAGATMHQDRFCRKRQIACELGCGLILRSEQWDTVKERHCTLECTKRLVPCTRLCGEQVVYDEMNHHLSELCSKRPAPPVKCRLGCPWELHGGLGEYEAMIEERRGHERDTCPMRIVRCDWPGCMCELKAKDRAEHRLRHLHTLGISTWTVPGTYKFKVPKKCTRILLQMWGGGAGGGRLVNRRGGEGGGGGFVEAEISVNSLEDLTIVVGAGGAAGVFGQALRTDEEIEAAGGVEHRIGYAIGGEPGGGTGCSSNEVFQCGGGGGFSALYRQGPFGREVIAVAGGGGGGGSRAGNPGGGFTGGEKIDHDGAWRSGRGGCQDAGGSGGVGGAQAGAAFAGGCGAMFGGGGGGGYFGGGGGGYTPGVVGGGGGGSSFIDRKTLEGDKMLTLPGNGRLPGGVSKDVPAATGIGEWDLVGGHCGEGGRASAVQIFPGNSGAVRIRLPKYYGNALPALKGTLEHLQPLQQPPPKEEHLIAPPAPEPPKKGDRKENEGVIALFNPNDEDEYEEAGSSDESLNLSGAGDTSSESSDGDDVDPQNQKMYWSDSS